MIIHIYFFFIMHNLLLSFKRNQLQLYYAMFKRQLSDKNKIKGNFLKI